MNHLPGPVALRPSLPADSIVDRRAAAAGRAARAPGRSAAQRPFGGGIRPRLPRAWL